MKKHVIRRFKSELLKPVNTTYEYDTDLQRWLNKTPIPIAPGAYATAVIDEKIHLGSGWSE
jgi:hypothetical protein